MGQTNDQDPLRDFPGFYRPRYTPIPDQLLDDVMAFLSGAELKVLLYIMRHTYGYKKSADNISLSQLAEGITTRNSRVVDRGTGLGRTAIKQALKTLEAKGLIIVERGATAEGERTINIYRVCESGGGSQNDLPQVGKRPTVGHKAATQEMTLQEQIVQDEDESLSFFEQVGKRWGRTERDARALAKAMSKYPQAAIAWAEELLTKRLPEIDNPAAWLNVVVPRLTEELAERERGELTRRQEDLVVIRATAHFYAQSQDPAQVRAHLLEDFGNADLVDEALGQVFGEPLEV
jgi:DNA-binding MarR family transcriptional regulator